jgi:MFS transporter, DHA1 family, tetracycline resistance protein
MLLISTAGAAVSYVLFAVSAGMESPSLALLLLVLSRMFAGICGGNITVAQAYIADVTPPEQRSKKMGLIGVAFGLGFIFGPILGAVGLKQFGASGPGWIAAALCAANFLFAFVVLKESLKPTSERVGRRPRVNQWMHTLAKPKVGTLVMVFFLSTFCFSCFESTLPLLVSDNFNLNIGEDEASAATVVYLFAYCGVIGVIVQGGAIGWLARKMGEPKLIAISLVLTGVSMAMLPFIKGDTQLSLAVLTQAGGLPWIYMLAALALLSVGTSLTRPPLFGLLSNLTDAAEQGQTIGVAQSAGSLARILGPIFATTLLHYIPALPYLICTAILLATTLVVVQRLCREDSPVIAGAASHLAKH